MGRKKKTTTVSDVKTHDLEGNTSQSHAHMRYCFTLHNYTIEDINELKRLSCDECAKFRYCIFAEEKGESGATENIFNGVINWHKNLGMWPDIIIIDIPRSYDIGYLNYTAIEKLKDGLFFSGKYESLTKMFDSPHVICMANFPPDLTQLSVDRWVLINLTDEEDIHSLDYGINYVNTTFLGFSQQA